MSITKHSTEVLVRPLSPESRWICTYGECKKFAAFILDRKAEGLVCDKHLSSAVYQALR